MSAQPTVSVVVPTHNREHGLERILRPLLQDAATVEVIVVVDGSSDDSLAVVERLAETEPRLRSLYVENCGEMGAREEGVRAACGEIVLFIDDDVLAEPGLVTGHARRHAGRAADVVLGYMPIVPPVRPSPGDFATRLYAREYEGRCAVYDRDRRSVLTELWAGNFSMRRGDCLAIGMANPRFTARYHADRDFGLRCLEAGLVGVFDRSLRAQHLHERTLPEFVRAARGQGAARVLLWRLHPSAVTAITAAEFERGLPGLAALLVRLGRRRRASAALAVTLGMLLRVSGKVRLWSAQEVSARLLRRLEQQRGAIEQSRRASRPNQPSETERSGAEPGGGDLPGSLVASHELSSGSAIG